MKNIGFENGLPVRNLSAAEYSNLKKNFKAFDNGFEMGYERGFTEGHAKGQENELIKFSNELEDAYLAGYKDCWCGEEPMVEDDELRDLLSDDFNSFDCNDNSWYSRYLDKRRRFEKFDDKPFEKDFPFSIERKSTDSDDYYKGICQGAKVVYEMLNAGIFEDSSIPVTYFSKESNRGMCCDWCMEDNVDEEDEDFEDEIYEAGFDAGFKQGYKIAHEEMCEDIYVDTEKVCKLDQLHSELLELGKKLHPSDIDKLNAVLKRVVDLKYDVAKDAVDDYLGYN